MPDKVNNTKFESIFPISLLSLHGSLVQCGKKKLFQLI